MKEEGASGTDSLKYAQQRGELGPMQVLPLGIKYLLVKVTKNIYCNKRSELVSLKPPSYC